MLWFIHQDASGASLRQTDKLGNLSTIGDAAEYDALGNNVGLSNPYVPEWIEPESGAQNTDFNLAPYGGGMGGTGGGMPSTRQYTSDGFRVSESEFMQELDRRYGGSFGILEMSVRMSRGTYLSSTYGYQDAMGREWRNLDRETAELFQRESHGQINVNNFYLVNDSWSLNWSLLSFNQRPQVQQEGENSKFVVYIDNSKEKANIRKVLDIVAYAMSKEECTKAFEAIDATPIRDQINNTTIVTEDMFTDPNRDSFWNRNSDIAGKLREGLSAHRTTNDLTWTGLYSNTGHRFLGLTNRAFAEKDDSLEVSVIHSLVHSGGVGGPRSWGEWATGKRTNRSWGEWFWGINPHDLRYLGKQYDDIIKHCTRYGSRIGKPER